MKSSSLFFLIFCVSAFAFLITLFGSEASAKLILGNRATPEFREKLLRQEEPDPSFSPVASMQGMDAEDHRVEDLPGLSPDVEISQFAGLVNVSSTGNQLFYWFFESFNDPKNDPLIFWLNGGPGETN